MWSTRQPALRSLARRCLHTAQNEPLLMIPGPVLPTEAVIKQGAMQPINHIGGLCLSTFSSSIHKMRKAWKADQSTLPFIMAGSGTLGMEMAMHNLLEEGSRALVLSIGYFGERFGDMARRIPGVEYTVETLPVGMSFTEENVAKILQKATDAGKPYDVIYCTHVDTSVGVRTDPKMVASMAQQHGALCVVDGVAGALGEEFEMSEWGVDVYLTGSQKVLAMHPGLSLAVVSERALERRKQLSRLPPSYMDYLKWEPIMRNYEEKKPSYFGTPATSLIPVLDVALDEVLSPSIEDTWRAHQRAGNAVRKAFEVMNLDTVAKEGCQANTLTAFYVPSSANITPVDILGKVKERGYQLAGPLLQPPHADPYVRCGHMGLATVSNSTILLGAMNAIQQSLSELGVSHVKQLPEGAAASAAEECLQR